LFAVYWRFLPIEVGGQRPGNVPMLIFYNGFIAATTAMLLMLLLIIVTKKTYVMSQVATFTRFRYLMFLMIKRDFVSRYRRSVLGVLWSLLNPILTMLILTMVFSHLFRFDVPNFPVYLLSGQLMFNFYSEATNSAMSSISGSAGTIKKIYVPKYIFPLTRVISSMVNLGFSFLAFIVVFVVTRDTLHWTILLAPLPILYLMLFCVGVGMLLSAASVFFRDLTYIYGVFLTALMFLTPIMYPVDILTDRVFHLIHLNPMFHYVNYFRDVALNGVVPGMWANTICLGFALAALGVGLYVKMSQQDKYILYL
jgi:ABC-type polysaccharide/polyol phosphate export permease